MAVAIVDADAQPLYQRIAAKALHLHELGLSNVRIAKQLGVDDKTIARALLWLAELGDGPTPYNRR